MIETRTEKRRLIITFGEHEAPTAYQFEAVKFVTEDGADVVPPARVFLDATADEAAAHMDAALVAQRDALGATAGEQATKIAALEAELAITKEALASATTQRDRAVAAYDQLMSEVEPV